MKIIFIFLLFISGALYAQKTFYITASYEHRFKIVNDTAILKKKDHFPAAANKSPFAYNMVTDKIIIVSEIKTDYSILLIDGKIVQRGRLSQGINTLSVITLPSGIFIFYTDGKGYKFIKN